MGHKFLEMKLGEKGGANTKDHCRSWTQMVFCGLKRQLLLVTGIKHLGLVYTVD